MKTSIVALALAGLLTGANALAAPVADKPVYGVHGFDLTARDLSVKPGDDFFQYANGAWLARTPIPSDKAAISLAALMNDLTEERLRGIMEGAEANVPHRPTTLAGKVGAFYKSFMDEARVEKLGASPLQPGLDEIRSAKSRADLAALMGRANVSFHDPLFQMSIDVDLKDPSRYSVYLTQAGLGLPDRDYYLKPEFAAQKTAYQAHVATVLKLAGWPDPEGAAKRIVDYETKISEASWTKIQQRDLDAIYNPMPATGLAAFAPGFDWAGYLKAAGVGAAATVIVSEKTAFPKLAALFAATDIATLKDWAAYHDADNASPYLSKAFADAWFELHAKTLGGQKEQKVRWKRGVHMVSGGDGLAGDRYDNFGNMSWAVGQLYTAKYFPPQAKAKIEALVQNLKSAYRVRIEHLDWMGPATKAEALKKLDTYSIKVGYPDHSMRDYSRLVILDDDLVGNVLRVAAVDWAYQTTKIGAKVDRGEWVMSPQTIDAYNGNLRDIVFPAAILEPPMFDPNADPAYNYGGVGGVIGHELTHGFDDEGRKIDAFGALRDWWTKSDADTFEARAKKLGAQYSRYEPVPGFHINGDLTMGENIADAGGLTLALDAYHASLGGKPAPVVDGYTGDQRVFLGWAQAWRGKATADAIKQQTASDPHSFRKFRVNGDVVNIDAWYAAFDVKPGDKMYIAPKDRVHIW